MSAADAIRARKTIKLLSEKAVAPSERLTDLEAWIELAGWAPFHRPCDSGYHASGDQAIVPWRMYALDAIACRKLRDCLPAEKAGKLPAMLACADALVQVTWLPNPPSRNQSEFMSKDWSFEPTLANMEHIAAASAAIQNLLLAATAAGVPSYWSSGGELLRTAEIFEWMQIPRQEILLGSVFLFPPTDSSSQRVESKLRSQRPNFRTWFRWVEHVSVGR
jgi:nitroreductase